ncbi:MAG: glycosyltransferase family 2 protein [Thermoplasmatota archaeon]
MESSMEEMKADIYDHEEDSVGTTSVPENRAESTAEIPAFNEKSTLAGVVMKAREKGVSSMEEMMSDIYAHEEDSIGITSVPENSVKPIAGIPAYNEERTIASVVLKAKRYVDQVVVVDDGSSDETAAIAEEAGAMVIRHGKNKGYGASLQTLINYAREKDTEPLVLLDGDGQHPVHEIPNLIQNIVDGEADITIGSRFLDMEDKEGVPLYRRFGIKFLTKLSGNSFGDKNGNRITDGQSGFRAFSRNALKRINPKEMGMGASAEILMEANDANLKIKEVPISISYEGDTSTENPLKHGLGVIGSIIRYVETKHSLLSFGLPGLIAFLMGIFMGINTVMIYNQTGQWPVVYVFVTVLLFFGGMTAGMTGLILHAIINAHKRGYD